MPENQYSYFTTPGGLRLLHASLSRNFTAEELRAIGEERPEFAHFSPPLDLAAPGDVAARLIQFARDRGLLDTLLEWAARRDPEISELLFGPPKSAAVSEPQEETRGAPSAPPVLPMSPPPKPLPLVQLRLDAAVPDRVMLGQAFDLAVAVRQPASPVLREEDLPRTGSGQVKISWPESEALVNLRIRVSTAECKIEGESSYAFQLYRGEDSPVFYFQLTPQRQGKISIIITVYQEDNWLGAARVATTVQEQLAGKVELNVESQPVSGVSLDREHLLRLQEQHSRNLRLLEEQKAQFGLRVPLDLLNEIEHERQALQEVTARLQA